MERTVVLMIIDLTHNKILEYTLSESFISSVHSDLVPKLESVFGDTMLAIQMYEDYLSDNFESEGYRYYPLSVLTDGEVITCWIKWNVSDKALFEGGNPYAFIGDHIEFTLADEVPAAFVNALAGRGRFFESGYVKVNVSFAQKDVTMLCGKYSQTFVDEMARQLTEKIESATGVKGLSESSIELDLFFAPDTYMEHTSDNITYRRLLMSAKGCAPRDFWIRWIRKNSSVAYGVNDNVSSDDIIFEIGENVSQKIREKEYRFLVYQNSDKYRNAMGRKNITEWRELIKRAIKKGELVKSVDGNAVEDHAAEVSDKLAEILEKCGVSVPVVTVDAADEGADQASEALRNAVMNVTASENAISAEDTEAEENTAYAEDTEADMESNDDTELAEDAHTASEEPDMDADNGEQENVPATEVFADFDFGKEYPQVQFDISDTEEDDADTAEEDNSFVFEIPKAVSAADEPEVFEVPRVEADTSDAKGESEDIIALMVEIERLEAQLAAEKENSAKLAEEKELANTRLDVAISANADVAEKSKILAQQLDEARDELAKAREAKAIADENIASLNEELVREKNENEGLRTEMAELKEKLAAAILENRKTEEKYRAQLELEEKERIRDKLLFAEAARQAKEESERLAREKAEAEARAEEERRAFEREKLEKEEAARIEAERAAEVARIEAEIAKAKERREDALQRAKEIRQRMEEAARRSADEKYGVIRTVAETAEAEPVADEKLPTETAEPVVIDEEPAIDFISDTEPVIDEDSACAEPETNGAEDVIDGVTDSNTVAEEPEVEEEPVMAAEIEDAPLAEEPAPVVAKADPVVADNAVSTDVKAAPVAQEPVIKKVEAPKYNYTSKIVRMLFRNAVDEGITAKIRELIAAAIKIKKKERVYIKMRASVPDSTTVVLDILQIPEEEIQLLVDIIHYLGNSNIGIYKVILE